MKHIKKFLSISLLDTAACLLAILFTLAGILVSLHRFWQYEIWYYDFGIFDQAIWKVAHFQIPTIDHFIVPGKVIFADHFSPGIFLLSPLYWFTTRQETLLIAQAFIVGVSGLLLYHIGKNLTKNSFAALTVTIAYFLFIGLENAVITQFHELTILVLPLTLVFWSIIKNKKVWYFIFLLLTLSLKESLFLLGVGLSLFIIFTKRDWKNISLATFFLSILWGILTIQVIIPHFSGMPYYYSPRIDPNFWGNVKNLFLPIEKTKTVFFTFLSFLFLPLLYPPAWPILILNFVSRFLSDGGQRWGLGFHYSAEIAPTLAVSSLYALTIIKKNSYYLMIAVSICLILMSLILYRFVFHGPFALAYNPVFYRHTQDFKFLDKPIKLIPSNKSVTAQNNLAVRFDHQQVWMLREGFLENAPDYVVFDLRSNQNPTNYLGVKNMNKLFQQALDNPHYKIIYHEADQYVFEKIR